MFVLRFCGFTVQDNSSVFSAYVSEHSAMRTAGLYLESLQQQTHAPQMTVPNFGTKILPALTAHAGRNNSIKE